MNNNAPSLGYVTRDTPRVLRPATDWQQQSVYFGASADAPALLGIHCAVSLDPQKTRRIAWPAFSLGAQSNGFWRADIVFLESGQPRLRLPIESFYGGGPSPGLFISFDIGSGAPGYAPPISLRLPGATAARAVNGIRVNVAADAAHINIQNAQGTGFANFNLFLGVLSMNE